MIRAGDIGGTSARLALCERNGRGFMVISEDEFSSAEFSGLDEVVENF